MRQSYVAPAESPDNSARVRRAPAQNRSAGTVIVAVLLDVAAVAFTAVLLWLCAGTTVLTGEPIAMSLAFAGGAVLASLSNLLLTHAGTHGTVTTALVYACVLACAYVLQVTVVQTYFFSWIVVYAGAFIAARVTVALVIDAFAGRANGALVWRLIAIAAGIAAILLLSNVWADSSLLADLIVFVFLLSIAAVLFELGIRSFRRSRTMEN